MNYNDLIYKESFSFEDIKYLLTQNSIEETENLRDFAYSVMKQNCSEKVYLRGLIEFSNYCINDCLYCGIRKSNSSVDRYLLSKDEILDIALWCAEQGYGSVVLQSGERSDKEFTDFVTDVVKEIKQASISEKLPNGLGITLCVGEQTYEIYKEFFEAGAHRYLLRIETSKPELFSKIHPDYQNYERRLDCLGYLKDIGFQVGTGVMIGIPGQTIDDLANDILFFKKMNVDMIGMGPFIPHSQTPYFELEDYYKLNKESIFKQALKMIAVTRIVLKDVNIASTTALQAMYPMGREAGLKYGANIIMSLLTPTEVRKQYQLYDGKPCMDEFSSDCFDCIQRRIESTGRTVALDEYGDSRHYKNKSL